MRNFLPIRLLTFPIRKAIDALGQINVPGRLMRRAFPNSRIVKGLAAINSGIYGVLFGKEKNALRKAKWARIDARYHEGVAANEQRREARREGRQEGRAEGRQQAAQEVGAVAEPAAIPRRELPQRPAVAAGVGPAQGLVQAGRGRAPAGPDM